MAAGRDAAPDRRMFSASIMTAITLRTVVVTDVCPAFQFFGESQLSLFADIHKTADRLNFHVSIQRLLVLTNSPVNFSLFGYKSLMRWRLRRGQLAESTNNAIKA